VCDLLIFGFGFARWLGPLAQDLSWEGLGGFVRIVALRKEGMGATEIARTIGCKRGNVYKARLHTYLSPAALSGRGQKWVGGLCKAPSLSRPRCQRVAYHG